MEIVIDGIKTYYEVNGNKGKPVVLMHGWGQNTIMMSQIANHLKEHFIVYNFDFPGHGQSDKMKESFSVVDYTEWFTHFLATLNIENPILIAHSFGCRVAIRYAYSHPVHKMVLTGAAGVRDDRDLKYYLRVYSYKAMKQIILHSPFKGQLAKLQNRVGSEDYRNADGVIRETLVKVVNDDIKDLLPSINVETLLVFGEKDEATPVSKGQLMESLMPDASLVIFENDDHYAYFNQAYRFNLVLDAFLRRDFE